MGFCLRIFLTVAFFFAFLIGIFNLMSLFVKPHKWQDLLIFIPLGWFIGGGFVSEKIYHYHYNWQIYGYPILLVIMQFFVIVEFFSLYKTDKTANEKYLYLAISAITSTVLLSASWMLVMPDYLI